MSRITERIEYIGRIARRFTSQHKKVYRQLSSLPVLLVLTACATAPTTPPVATKPVPVTIPNPTNVQTPAADNSVDEIALRSLVAQQDRLYQVAAPLLVNNPELCKGNARNLLGFTAKNLYSYPTEYTNAAKTLLGMNDRLKVMGVLPASGAARMGLQQGDDLIAIEDKILPTGQNAERQAALMLSPMVNANKRTNVKLTIQRSGTNMAMNIPLTYACAFGIELGNTDNVNAYNDGHRVLITRGMLNITRSDEELAYVMAKEMAHNALSHANRLRMSATVGGIIDNLLRVRPDMSGMSGMAGVKPMPQELDAAADRLSLYMLARAGYNIDNVPAFWQRVAAQYPATVLNGYTALHPSTAYRLSTIDKTTRDIRVKQAARKALLP